MLNILQYTTINSPWSDQASNISYIFTFTFSNLISVALWEKVVCSDNSDDSDNSEIFVKQNCMLRQFRYSYRRSWADSESGLTFLPSLTRVNIPFDMWHNIWVPKVQLPQSTFTWKGYIEEHYPKINRRLPLKIVMKPWREFGDKLAACCVTDYTGGWRWLVLKYNENTERVQTALYFLLLVFWLWYCNEKSIF